MDETALRIAIAMALSLVLIATVFLTGSPRSIDGPALHAVPAPPPRPSSPPPALQVELTRADVKRQLAELTALLRELDRSTLPKEEVGPLWRALIAARKNIEEPDPDLPAVSAAMREIESNARILLAK